MGSVMYLGKESIMLCQMHSFVFVFMIFIFFIQKHVNEQTLFMLLLLLWLKNIGPPCACRSYTNPCSVAAVQLKPLSTH